MRATFAAFSMIALLGACASTPIPGGGGEPPAVSSKRTIVSTAPYTCEDGTSFTAVFLVGNMGAELHFPDGNVAKLSPKTSGSGFIYASSQHRLQGKGNEALYTFGRRAETKCAVTK
jgi:membrane-bound inhibitor of C-type lysozyme